MKDIRRLTTLSMLISAALVLHIVEGLIPIPVPVPGIKLGFANIITLITIMFFRFREVILLVVLRSLLASLFGGGISGFLFSVTGGLASAIVMWILYKKFSKYFSIIAISIIGAIFHNIGQLLVASIYISDFRIYGYLPVLMISSVITGFFIGVICKYAKNLIIKNIDKLGLNFDDK